MMRVIVPDVTGRAFDFSFGTYAFILACISLCLAAYSLKISLKPKFKVSWEWPSFESVIFSLLLFFALHIVCLKSYHNGYNDACRDIYKGLLRKENTIK